MARVARPAELCLVLLMIGWINAAFFILVTAPLWGGGSLALASVAVLFGITVISFYLILGFAAAINVVVQYSETHLGFGDVLSVTFRKIAQALLDTVVRFWDWLTILPEWFWDFARYDHPWLAFFISLVLIKIWDWTIK